MKIVSGLGSIDDYITLAKAGADEFFCGYVPFRWYEKHGILSPLNRREVLYYNVQIGTQQDLFILKKMVDVYGVPVKITLNSLFYTPDQYPLIADIMKECIEAGFNVFILSDPAFILYVRENKIPCTIHLSGETAEVNRPMMKVFNEWNVSRYIFHRKNSIEDMKRCIQEEKNLEYEAFVLNEYCHFTGAFCNSLHCDELSHLCKVPYQMGRMRGGSTRFLEVFDREEESLYSEEYLTGSSGCGLCALKELKAAGITHLKLVGRGNHVAYMEQDIKQMKRAIKLADEIADLEEYRNCMKKEIFVEKCSGICYYN